MLSLGARKISRRNADIKDMSALSSFPPLLQRIYAARSVKSASELTLTLANLVSYNDLKGIDKAVKLLENALEQGEKLLIIGDFDADGATSCALAMKALTAMGAAKVEYLVPNRFEFGYGLTPEIVTVAAKTNPDIIITVDNGISSIAGVAAARELGIKVIVTDHHLAGKTLPNANAIINPNQPGCNFTAKNTAGVGVIFYLMTALRAALRSNGWFDKKAITEPNMADYLDLVALGTVADVVPLDHNNRILIAQGIKRIRATKASLGLLELLKIAGKDSSKLAATDLAFTVGPRLNAAGRLEDMSLGIECLLTTNQKQALLISNQLDELNKARKTIEQEMKAQAQQTLISLNLPSDVSAICLFDATWHQGVIGILASRIKEQFHKPVIVFAESGDGEIKGSARSITGFHIRDALDEIATKYPNILQKFGGHAMAAGLSIQRKHLEVFTKVFTEYAQHMIQPQHLENIIYSDGELTAEQQNIQTAQLLKNAGPWGQHFEEPMFDGVFDVLDSRILGNQHLKLVLALNAQSQPIEAIAFFVKNSLIERKFSRVKIVYKLDINEYRGNKKLQFIIEYLEPLEHRAS